MARTEDAPARSERRRGVARAAGSSATTPDHAVNAQPIDLRIPGGAIQGQVAPGFERVAEAFRENFLRLGELGAALCVVLRGQPVVDLWGGVADQAAGRAWDRDTPAPLFSTGKGAIAIACGVAVSRGHFAYDDRVAQHWPGFAAHGKGDITIRQILDHSAGLPRFGRAVGPETLDDAERMSEVIEAMVPAWEPGTAWGYHLATFGPLLSQIITRTDPRRRHFADFFDEEIARPLGLDLQFGLSFRRRPELARLSWPGALQLADALTHAPFGFQWQVLNPLSSLRRAFREIRLPLDERAWLAHDMPSGNALGTARSVTRLYDCLLQGGGALSLRPDVVCALSAPPQPPRDGIRDQVVNVDNLWHLGFVRPSEDFAFRPSLSAFGMPGLGGSFGFCDEASGIAYAYVPNRVGLLPFDDRRERRLRAALDACLQGEG